MLSIILLSAILNLCTSQVSLERITRQDGANGSPATLLSISSIHQSGVFGDDNEMLRRIAYTETRDGTRSGTFRAGYHGGIWAVDESEFSKTKDTKRYKRLAGRLEQIQIQFGINWGKVQWRDLRKPIFSALAARLVLYVAPALIPPAFDIEAQSQFWVSHYNRDGDASSFVTTSSGLQGSILESAANEFFLGFSFNLGLDNLQLFVNTPEPNPVSFSVTASGYSFTGTATNTSTTVVTLPQTLVVASSTERNKGIRVKAQDERVIVVYGISYEQFTTDAFLALPCTNLAVDTYEYYGITYHAEIQSSDVLLVGCEDDTVVTTSSDTITINQQETYLINRPDITGYKVTSNKPLSFFSNHRCTNVPIGVIACDHLTEQIPPTFTWGRSFFVASLQGRQSGELYRVLTSQSSTVVKVMCISASDREYTLPSPGSFQEFQLSSSSFCSIESNAPIIVMQFALGNRLDNVGDPFMMMIPPVEQYSNNYVLNALALFSTNFITIYVSTTYYQPNRIFVDNRHQGNAVWTAVRCETNPTCGYITRVQLTSGEHRLYHLNPDARVGVSAYGFNNFNSYGYSGGLKLTPIQLATVSFKEANSQVSENAMSLNVEIIRSGNTENVSVVLVATDNFMGTASVREDYNSISQIVEFQPGQTEKDIMVQIKGDSKIEFNETFTLYLMPGDGVTLTPISRTEITIVDDDGIITLTPSYGSMLGGTGVIVAGEGLLIKESTSITCLFDGNEVKGVFVNSKEILCVSPILKRTGRLPFILNISGSVRGVSSFNSLSYTKSYGVHLDNDDLLFFTGTMVNVNWSPGSIFPMERPETYNVDIYLLELNVTTGNWKEMVVTRSLENDGSAEISVPKINERSTLEDIISPIVVTVALSNKGSNTELLSTLSKLNLKTYQQSPVRFLRRSNTLMMQELCTEWYNQEPPSIGTDILDQLPPCPLRQRDVVAVNSGYVLQRFASTSPVSGTIPGRIGNLVSVGNGNNILVDDKYKEYFHSSIAECYRLRRTDLGGHSQQCCYSSNGFLATGPSDGGNVDLVAPDVRILDHFSNDVIPYLLCCKAEQYSKCRNFYERRPSDRGFDFSPPPPAITRTDPHMVTFDGHQYTFNGKGEYWLIHTQDNSFSLQGRMLPIPTAQNTTSAATVYKAIVARQNNSDTVQFEITENNNFVTLVNNEQVDFEFINEQEFQNVVVNNLGNNTFSASFSSGAYIEAKEEIGMISVFSVSLPTPYQAAEIQGGLMGSFNGNVSDDLLPRSIDESLPLNSSIKDIHEQFGITWIVDSPLDSIFTYQPGQTWATFYDPYFIPVYEPTFSNSSIELLASNICGSDLQCLFDVAATGRIDIGIVSAEIGQQIERMMEVQSPVECPSSCGFGVCIGNYTCNCELGYTGTNCLSPLFTACEVNPCLFGGACIKQGTDNICSCPPGTRGDFCEIAFGTTVNDTVIGDPLYTVPIRVPQEQLDALGLTKLSLCYEVHGKPGRWFNLVSDDCVSISTRYASLTRRLNIMDSVALRAVDNASQCVNIRVDVDQCSAMVDSSSLDIMSKYESNGIMVKRYRNRVRLTVPNCQDLDLVVWVICENNTLENPDQPGTMLMNKMIKFVIMRGLNFGSHQAHGLIGQFWNVPVSITPYNGLLRGGTPAEGWYIVNITTSGVTRAYAGFMHSDTWDKTGGPCLFVGNRQSGPISEIRNPNDPVIQEKYTSYEVKDPFAKDAEYKFGMFNETVCS